MPPRESPFVRRENRDGTIDSICRACFVTIHTSIWESELEQAEKNHTCDPEVLAHWDRLARQRSGES
jgi:hypothetical protein